MRAAAWIAVLGLGLGGSTGAIADPRPHGGSAGAVADPRPAGAPPVAPDRLADRRERVKKKIRAMRAYLLTEELALDEQTAGRLFPVLARYDDEIDKLLERRIELQRRLQRAGAQRDPRAIDRLIDDAVANQHGFWELEDRRLAELRKILSPVQSARLLVVLPALERRIERQLRRSIVQRRGAAARPDPDDDLEADDPASPAPRTGH